MRLEKVLTVCRRNPNEKAIDLSRHLTGDERVSLLEDLREEMAMVTHSSAPGQRRAI